MLVDDPDQLEQYISKSKDKLVSLSNLYSFAH
jgi:hypothetical protein